METLFSSWNKTGSQHTIHDNHYYVDIIGLSKPTRQTKSRNTVAKWRAWKGSWGFGFEWNWSWPKGKRKKHALKKLYSEFHLSPHTNPRPGVSRESWQATDWDSEMIRVRFQECWFGNSARNELKAGRNCFKLLWQ